MNATSRTLTFAAVALVSALAAVSTWFGSRPAAIEGFADVGQEFSPKFEDPLTATSLTVAEYNDKARESQAFSVKQNDNGNWVIPSHHDYPAEAKDRLARTAASMIGIRKNAVQSRSKEDWKNYGVVDPAAEGAATKEERGTRITLRDASGNALVDLIVGKKVEGREKHYYIREPEKNTTYVAEMQVDLSAKFADWIEPDLLKVNQNDIVQVTVDNYSINEEEGALVPGETLKFSLQKENPTATGKWMLDGLDDASEKLDENAVRDITRNLDQLKIVGVRPKPEGLNADLTMSKEVAENPLLRQVLQADMQRQGFFAARTPEGTKLVSNEGELVAGASNGVRYTLYFGEIARGTEKDIEVGFAGEKKPDDAAKAAAEGEKKEAVADPAEPPKADEPKTDETEGGPRRYLLVKVDFDEQLLGPAPVEPTAPVKPATPEEAAAATPPAAEEKPAASEEKPAGSESKPADPAAPTEPAAPAETPAPAADAVPEAESKPEESAKEEETTCSPADEAAEGSNEATSADGDQPASDAAAVPGEPAAGEPAAEPAAADSTDATPAAAEPAVTNDAAPASETPAADTSAVPADAPPSEPAAPADSTTPPAEAAKPAETPAKDPKQIAEEEYKRAMGEYEAKKAAYDTDVKARAEKLAAGKKAAEELSTRFGSWYYVISADSFEKFRIERKTVVSAKTEDDKKAPAGGAPGGGGLPGFPGLPPAN